MEKAQSGVILGSQNKKKCELYELFSQGLVVPTTTKGSPQESGLTLAQNARKKAMYTRWAYRDDPNALWFLGDDTGLFVPYLMNRPGVWTNRYSPERTPEANANLLLREMSGAVGKQRRAVFCSSVSLVGKQDTEITNAVTVQGFILDSDQCSTKMRKAGFGGIFNPGRQAASVYAALVGQQTMWLNYILQQERAAS